MKRAISRTLNSPPLVTTHIRPTNHLRIVASRAYASMGPPPLKDKSLFKSQAYVNGKWVDAKSGQTFEVENPATGEIIGTMPEMNKDDTEAAIDAAAAALPSFKKTTGRQRSKMLRKWYDLMMENHEDIAKLIMWENGKPIGDARGEATYAANFFEWFSEEAPRNYGDTIPATVPGNRVFTIKEPVGVAGLITPWVSRSLILRRKESWI
jgi:succinate-semialdehyde dehydrogenase / glutarate-semialdehyde dehydrogenase